MADYKTTDKTEWFIRKMRSGWFTRREIVGQAASEFPDIPSKTLDGTMGQYWSDSVNPKWGTYKAIRALGLTVEEKDGRRRIMPNGGASTTASASYKVPSVKTLQAQPRRSVSCTDRRDEGDQYSASKTREMWNSNKLELWEQALARYWTKVKASNLALEKEMAQLNVEVIRMMDPQARMKAAELNRVLSTTEWTPRKVDMVLWTCAR
jgi:hypothetical protein